MSNDDSGLETKVSQLQLMLPLYCLLMFFCYRLQKEWEVLKKYLDDEQDLKETEAYTKASEVLTDAQSVLEA